MSTIIKINKNKIKYINLKILIYSINIKNYCLHKKIDYLKKYGPHNIFSSNKNEDKQLKSLPSNHTIYNFSF